MFGGEASDKPVRVLSGGERTRLAMIRLLLQPVNFLILDEPTNHLDMRSKDVLKEAIASFEGTVILVSHDRDFLDGLVTKVYEFGGGRVKEHIGGIYDFLRAKNAALEADRLDALFQSAPKKSAVDTPVQETVSQGNLDWQAQKELNRRIKKLEKQIAECEASVEETDAAIAILEKQMATPEGAADVSLYERHARFKKQQDETMELWEQASEELEKLRGKK